MTEHAGRYQGVGDWMIRRGIVVAAADHPGHGTTTTTQLGNLGEMGWESIVSRVTQVILDLSNRFSNVPIYILGHSMGSFVVHDYLARTPAVAGAILTGGGYESPLLTGFGAAVAGLLGAIRGRSTPGTLIYKILYGGFNRPIKNPRTPFDWLSRDKNVVDSYCRDPLCGFVPPHSFYQAVFSAISRIHRDSYFDRIAKQIPILVMSGDSDPVTHCGTGAQELVRRYRRAGVKNVEYRQYVNARHVILDELNRDQVMTDILTWIQELPRTKGNPEPVEQRQ